MSLTFKELNLAAPLLEAVEALGFTATTPVQEQVFPAAMAGGDLMVSSQTGSGKTAAFLLPLLQKLIEANPNNKPIPGRAEPTYSILCFGNKKRSPQQKHLKPKIIQFETYRNQDPPSTGSKRRRVQHGQRS